ncbi:MAG: hypothetical protein ACRYG4_02585, partial [Janthinobacterium lividum]
NIALDPRGISMDIEQLKSLSQTRDDRLRIGPPPPSGPSRTVIVLKQKLNELDASLALLHDRGPENPDYLMAMAQRPVLVSALQRETALDQVQANSAVTVVRTSNSVLDADYLRARLQVLGQAPLYDRLAAMEREIAMRQTLYAAAVSRVHSFDMIAAAPSGIRVIGDVIGDDTPSFPNRPLIGTLAAVFGLGLGLSIALLGELITRRIRGAEDLEFSSRVPVLAVIAPGPARPTARRWWHFGRHGWGPEQQPAE